MRQALICLLLAAEIFVSAQLSAGEPFRRGDANSDTQVDITDMGFILNFLFQGSAEPACKDAADVNDDGALDITDAIFGLNYLFSGGSEPPAPGPKAPDFDGTPSDEFKCGDELPPACVPPPVQASTLPGVHFEIAQGMCSMTLAEAAAGVSFKYSTIVENDLPSVTWMPRDAGNCDGLDENGLVILEQISGDGQSYCVCDTGRCVPQDLKSSLMMGLYERHLDWDGKNWFGPSDFGNPKGPPFPPGTYQFMLKAQGTFPGPDGRATSFEMTASAEFQLLP